MEIFKGIFAILCINMILLLMTGSNFLTKLLKMFYTYDNDHTNCNDTCTESVIRDLC